MGYYYIVSSRDENHRHFKQFVTGIEVSLAYIYTHLYKTIRRYGLRIVKDDFVVDTIIQEAFLKVWAFRERMTSIDHVIRFLKLTVRWECMAYYRSPIETLHRKALRIDWTEGYDMADPVALDDPESENRLHLLRSLIPKLPGERQRTIMTLYAKDGMTASQIAKRLHTSPQAIGEELRRIMIHLRAIVKPNEGLKSASSPILKTELRHIDGLTGEAAHIVKLRRDMKYSFGQIADLLKLPQPYVQKQYVEAWKKMTANESARGKGMLL